MQSDTHPTPPPQAAHPHGSKVVGHVRLTPCFTPIPPLALSRPCPVTMTKDQRPTWPLHSVGPHAPAAPLRRPLVRLIPGSPRHNKSPIEWLEPPPAHLLHPHITRFQLAARLDSDEAALPINTADTSKWFKSRFDFLLPAEISTAAPAAHIRFTLSRSIAYESEQPVLCLGSLLLADIPRDAGELSCILYRPSDDGPDHHVPCARLLLTYLHTTASPHAETTPAPTQNGDCNMPTVSFAPRFVGHRGMGSSGPHAPHRPVENSIESFMRAACTADGRVRTVELDVQMTKDDKVVIYHDWFFRPRDEEGHPLFDRDAVRIPIRNLTMSQFDSLFRQSVAVNKHFKRQADARRGDMTRYHNGNVSKPNPPSPRPPHHDLQTGARSLRDVCDALPDDVGILVELKYPSPDVQETFSLPYPKRDMFVNGVLAELFAHGLPRRKIAFLCFEPDICDMLALKQDSFPVYLSHCETMDKPCDEFDPRTISLSVGFDFVKSYKLHGLMLLNKLIKKHPRVISEIVSEKLPIITYGASNSDTAVVKAQFDAGVTGVIADDVHNMLKSFGVSK